MSIKIGINGFGRIGRWVISNTCVMWISGKMMDVFALRFMIQLKSQKVVRRSFVLVLRIRIWQYGIYTNSSHPMNWYKFVYCHPTFLFSSMQEFDVWDFQFVQRKDIGFRSFAFWGHRLGTYITAPHRISFTKILVHDLIGSWHWHFHCNFKLTRVNKKNKEYGHIISLIEKKWLSHGYLFLPHH